MSSIHETGSYESDFNFQKENYNNALEYKNASLDCFGLNETLANNISECLIVDILKPSINSVANIILQICYGLAFAFGVCGNSLVIYVVARFSKMQTVTNYYILNLAIADELFVVGIPFLMATSSFGYWPFGAALCKFYMTFTSLNQFTSSMFLTIMCADRYIAVCHPINSPKIRTLKISKVVAGFAWIFSAIMITPVLLYANASKVDGVVMCNIFWPTEMQKHFTIFSFVTAFGIPVSFFIIFYSLVLAKLRDAGPNNLRSSQKQKSHRKVTKMVLTVITVYVFCYLPYWVLQVTLIQTRPTQRQSQLMLLYFLFSSCLSYINSAINPVLYAFLSENFKKSFLKACTCTAVRDVNNLLQFETSIFPKKYRSDSNRTSTRVSRHCSLRERKSSFNPVAVPVNKDLLTVPSRASLKPVQPLTIKEAEEEIHFGAQTSRV